MPGRPAAFGFGGRCAPSSGFGGPTSAATAPKPPDGVAAPFGCKAGERAYELAGLKHGVFFHHVLEGLRGEAADRDDEVTFAGPAGCASRRIANDVTAPVGGGATQSPTLETTPRPSRLWPRRRHPKADPPAAVAKGPKPGKELDIGIAKGMAMPDPLSCEERWEQAGPTPRDHRPDPGSLTPLAPPSASERGAGGEVAPPARRRHTGR